VVKKTDGYEFEEKIISEQKCHCLLPYDIRRVDEESYYYFKTSGYISLKAKLSNKKTSIEEYKCIYQKIFHAVEEIEEYLLPAENILLEAETIFYDEEKEKIYFCYIPGREKDLMQQLLDLTEEILEIINYEDRKLVEYLYGLHETISEGRLPIFDEIENDTNINPIQNSDEEKEELFEDFDYEEEEQIFFKEEVEVKQSGKWYVEIGISVVLNLIDMFLIGYQLYGIYQFGWNMDKGKILIVFFIVLICNSIYMIRKSKLRATPEKFTTILTEEESVDKIGKI
jgi:hypothetical protein